MHSIPLELAKQKLIFYVAQDLDQSIRSNVQQLVNKVAASRIWSVTPPSFIDEIDESGTEVVGGILEIYSALPPNLLPIEMDSKNLDDVEALVGAVKKLSENESLSFEFQLDTTYVGAIEDGVIDRVLLDGLLVPWRNHLKGKI
ncbi:MULTISPECIES: hypothetical protein [Pseudomonas fluorescens group]|uniref:Uncharacterized protein n=2 Tax=Pseudomonas fluorescens TaxID=294 RepID=C3KCX4_PSEFS|nr:MULTISPECIES: hypothetical protein [Pseudomonas fluorescens group]MBZ6454273.1 hypothetical protein [Pseudomonas fluorescens group sp.]MBZ6460259.1 hypothetical protein [Pseudomonas fluorescens group sp.]MBZ6465900.1 hypothetical protein [Pseudomonas fluorescens group sp.]WPN20790.1 hypothetical protein QMK57_15280 [Pseudomonas marginalis]WQD69619.1 hypothetical protein U0037_16220 [Pseudomonas marginalis]